MASTPTLAEEVLTQNTEDLFELHRLTTPTPIAEVLTALRGVKGFEDFTDDQLRWLAAHGNERRARAGALIFRGGEAAHHMTILLQGEVHVTRVRNTPTMFFVGRTGHITGKLPFSRMKTYGGDGIAAEDIWSLDIEEADFPAMIQAVPAIAQISVSALLDRVREVTRIEQQAEKLNALGKLAANLSHELNNPASAARSAANNLWTELRNYGNQKFKLGSMCFDAATKQAYIDWVASMQDMLQDDGRPLKPDGALEVSDREEKLLRWLTAHDIQEPWRIAPIASETRIDTDHLDQLASIMPSGEALSVCVHSFASALQAERMTDAVVDSTRRIFALITAIKDYSFMDQAPIQEIDPREALENCLAMLNSRLGAVQVVREYADGTPNISAYGGELNQVWTALLENALDAMQASTTSGQCVLTLRTSLSGGSVLVDVCDNGPGIPDDIRSRIFEPFFTTKPVGQALGLGLDTASRIVTKHKGQLSVTSTPGETCITVRLPIEQTGAY